MPRKPLACKLHHISHVTKRAWIETTKRKRNMKGGRYAPTIEILLRTDYR